MPIGLLELLYSERNLKGFLKKMEDNCPEEKESVERIKLLLEDNIIKNNPEIAYSSVAAELRERTLEDKLKITDNNVVIDRNKVIKYTLEEWKETLQSEGEIEYKKGVET